MYYRQIEYYIDSAFSSKEFMEIEPEDLTLETDIKVVVRRLKEDFGEDLSYIFDLYEKADPIEKEHLLTDLVTYYKKTGEWAKKDYDLAVEFAKDTIQKAYGFSKLKVDKIFNDNSSAKLKIAGYVTRFSFLISCLTFVAVIIILCAAY